MKAGLKRAEDKLRSLGGAVRAGSEWGAALQFPLAVVVTEARAADLGDALPFLKAAESLELVEIVDSMVDKPAALARLSDVAAFLHRHGIAASATVDVEDKHATGAGHLLELAEQKRANLILAGGYGHTRFQEWVFGGFTRALLAQS